MSKPTRVIPTQETTAPQNAAPLPHDAVIAEAKSARKSVKGAPFKRGRDERRGRGPQPGAPNAGRPPELVRQMFREGAAEGVQFLRQVSRGQPVKSTAIVGGVPMEVEVIPDVRDRTRAIDVLGKYGLPTEVKVAFDATQPLIVRFEDG